MSTIHDCKYFPFDWMLQNYQVSYVPAKMENIIILNSEA